MDAEQKELQPLSFFGIFKESLKIITSCTNIFSQLTIRVIVLFYFCFALYVEIAKFLFEEINSNEYALVHTQPAGSQIYSKILNILSSEWTTFWLFQITYFIFFLILSLLSTSAVVYTIVCIYTAKEETVKKVTKVVPKFWKRLMVTFIWTSIIVLAYSIVALLVLILCVVTLGPSFIRIIAVLFLVIYLVGIYISIIWPLASVVSVSEDVYGVQALSKSKDWFERNILVCAMIFIIHNLCFLAIQVGFEVFVIGGDYLWRKYWYGYLLVALLIGLILFIYVIGTVIYFRVIMKIPR